MLDLLMSTTLLASFLGGVVALLAPCCVSVMLPAYFASTFRTRRGIVAMTCVFAAGVATVILPIALGASAFSRLFASQHTLIFTIGGTLMAAMGIAMLAGWKMRLPMPGMPARHPDLAAAVVQCPVFSGRAVVSRAGVGHLARMTGPILSDTVRAALGLPRRYVPLVGRPTSAPS